MHSYHHASTVTNVYIQPKEARELSGLNIEQLFVLLAILMLVVGIVTTLVIRTKFRIENKVIALIAAFSFIILLLKGIFWPQVDYFFLVLIADISLAILVSTLFYSITILIPDWRKKQIAKRTLQNAYNDFKYNSILTMRDCVNDFNTPVEDLMTPEKFRSYFNHSKSSELGRFLEENEQFHFNLLGELKALKDILRTVDNIYQPESEYLRLQLEILYKEISKAEIKKEVQKTWSILNNLLGGVSPRYGKIDDDLIQNIINLL